MQRQLAGPATAVEAALRAVHQVSELHMEALAYKRSGLVDLDELP